MEARIIANEEEISGDVQKKIIKPAQRLSEREKRMIDKVLAKYNFQVTDIAKVRSLYKIDTTTENICLRRLKHGKHKPINGSILVEELNKSGFLYTIKYYRDKNKNIYVRYKDSIFYASEWIDGEEVNLNNIEEAINCIKSLAQYHLITRNIDTRRLKLRNNSKNWPQIYKDSLQDLEKFERIIIKRRIKSEFDTMYQEYIENFYQRGMVALNFLNTSEFYKLMKLVNINKTLCYDSYYYENILKKNDNYYIVDLDSIILDLQINDIGKLIRKLMFKKSYEWNFEKAQLLIDAYNSVNKLNKNEIEILLALIIFPSKFSKLGKKRYIKRRDWDESKYLRKLTKIIKYNDNQNKFLDDYLRYINDYK